MRWMKILFVSLFPPLIMIYIGLSHNAMMEFCENDTELASECVIDIGYVVSFFSIWYLFSLAIITVLFYLFNLARRNLIE